MKSIQNQSPAFGVFSNETLLFRYSQGNGMEHFRHRILVSLKKGTIHKRTLLLNTALDSFSGTAHILHDGPASYCPGFLSISSAPKVEISFSVGPRLYSRTVQSASASLVHYRLTWVSRMSEMRARNPNDDQFIWEKTLRTYLIVVTFGVILMFETIKKRLCRILLLLCGWQQNTWFYVASSRTWGRNGR